jgi:GNAT superfamily N-acetyltransferase
VTLSDQVAEIGERFEKTGIRLKEALSVIDMTFEDQMNRLETSSPYEAFRGLSMLFDRTVRGSKIEHFRPGDDYRHFHTLEIYTEKGENLGYANMLYLKRVIPCYYLVYVEIMPSFRGLGLGNRILTTFMEFVRGKRAVGLLDNIVPAGEPTYEIYTKLGWKALSDFAGNNGSDEWANYMVYVPESIQPEHLKDHLTRILFNLMKRRSVIDMHDNEDMVKRTIEEFRSVYMSLTQLFAEEFARGVSTPLMRFMFTRLATQLIGFRRRIAALIGYTGGESLSQVSFSGRINELAVQPYSPWNLEEEDAGVWGDEGVLRSLPGDLKEEPTFFVESLPLYRRPYLKNYTEVIGAGPARSLKISDLFDLGFDPTRLKEFHHEGVDYIFERAAPLFFSFLIGRRKFLKKVEKSFSGSHVNGVAVRTNPILLIFRDRGNIYILRRKVEGIHSQEALDQLRTVPYLADMNRAVGIDRAITKAINDTGNLLKKKFHAVSRQEIEDLTYFVPWDIEKNIPKLRVDISKISLVTLWIA